MKSLRLVSTQSLLERDYVEDGLTKISLKSLLRRTDPRSNDLISGPKPTFIDLVKERTDKLWALMKMLGQPASDIDDLRFRPGEILLEMDRLIEHKQAELSELESRTTKAIEEHSSQQLCPQYVAGTCTNASCTLSHASDLLVKWADGYIQEAIDVELGKGRIVAALGKHALHEVLMKLSGNEAVTSLAIHAASKESSKALFRALSTSLRHITTLNLSGNNFGIHNTSGLATLALLLKSNNTLKTLVLDDNRLGSKGMLTILRGFETPGGNTSITTLSLQRNGVAFSADDTRFPKICAVLKKNRTIKHVALGGNMLGAGVYAEILEENKTLRHLDLFGSALGDTFADGSMPAWCDALKNTQIPSLDLRWNKLNAEYMQAVLDGLADSTHHKLTALDLSCNNIGKGGSVRFADFMKAQPNLVRLDLKWLGLPEDNVGNIVEGMAHCSGLGYVDISQNGLDKKVTDRVKSGVRQRASKGH